MWSSDGQVGQERVCQGKRRAGTCKALKQERARFMEGVKEVEVCCTVDGGIPLERLLKGGADKARSLGSL